MDWSRIVNKGRGKNITKTWMGDVKVSSSLLSSCIYSYPYFVEEDLQTPSSPQRPSINRFGMKKDGVKDLSNLKKVCHYPSTPSSCTAHPEQTSKSKKTLTKRFNKDQPSALKTFDKRFYKNFASECSMEKVVRPKCLCTALSPIKLSHMLKGKMPEPKHSSNIKKNNMISKINTTIPQITKLKNNLKSKKVEAKERCSVLKDPLFIKPSKSCGTCDHSKVTRSFSMTIAKITLNEDDRGVFVPFSWLEKFNAEEIRLKLIRKELSKIPKPVGVVGTASNHYKSRQSTLICKIARSGSI